MSSCPTGAPVTLVCKTVAVALDPAKPDGARINLAVTVRQADPSSWTSPIVVFGSVNWDVLAYLDPEKPSFGGHDLIDIDWRGQGRSEGANTCTTLNDYTGEINTWRLSSAASAAMKACIAKADPAQLALLLDHAVFAADVVAVRRALGIDKWMMWAGNGNVDYAMHVLKDDAKAVTALMARDPNVVGTTAYASTVADAFDRFAADCATSPKCAANGDMKVLLAKALDRLKAPATTKTLDKSTGLPVVLDVLSLQSGIRTALFDSSLTPILPGLIAGLATGEADELVAGFYASRPTGLGNAVDLANSCPTLGWLWPTRPAVAADDHPGLFAGYSNQRLCDAVGAVPQITAPPKIASDIPVLVILSSYDSRSSEAVAKSIFTGFSHATFTTATGVSSPLQKAPCFFTVTSAFVNAPTTPVDTSCMGGTDGNTFT
jgi:pimeloyl-ACP methyl ester carboxylesterase